MADQIAPEVMDERLQRLQAALNATQIKGISASQLKGLSTTDIGELADTQVAALTTTQVVVLTISGILCTQGACCIPAVLLMVQHPNNSCEAP